MAKENRMSNRFCRTEIMLGSSGYSPLSMPMNENSVLPHLTVVLLSSSEDIVTMPSGMRRTISPNSFASRTMLPGSETSASTVVYMPFFRSYPVTLSRSPASSRTPSSVGIGLFAAAALAHTATAA